MKKRYILISWNSDINSIDITEPKSENAILAASYHTKDMLAGATDEILAEIDRRERLSERITSYAHDAYHPYDESTINMVEEHALEIAAGVYDSEKFEVVFYIE